jgi:pseudouridine kinase
MALALSDMEVCERITPSYLSANQQILQNAQVIVADTNIPTESLVYLAENCAVPIFCDPVSTIKAEKLRPILSKIHTLKPNRLEAELLSGVPIREKADVEKAAAKLLETGLSRVFISLGGDGMYAATGDGCCWMENLPCRMVNTTGCGDSSMAALVWAYLEELSLPDTVRAALAAGSITIESPETISPMMSADAIRERMG